jgi:RNA polymerase sigma-70 factor (ECF subfamily)
MGLPAGGSRYQTDVPQTMTKLRLVQVGESPGGLGERPDDARLVAAVRSGNSGMAGAFYDRTRPVVEKSVHRLLGGADSDFDDLVQIAMIELLRSLDRYRGDCSLDTWAATIAANMVYKHIRRRGLERRIFARELAPEETPRRAHQQPILRGMVTRVLHHLQQISHDRAWTFLLHDVQGYSLDEVAAMTGASVAAAQSRLVRGRRELHERIAKDPDLAGGLDELENHHD